MGEVYTFESQLQLVNAIKANDSQALRALYLTNYPKVENLVLKNNGSKEHAKDIYQEAFIAMWNKVKNDMFVPENESALNGFLYQIAKNKWMDVVRSSRFKKTNFINDELSLVDRSFEQQEQEQQALQAHKMKRAMEAFAKMGNPCKELLKAFYFEKQSLRDIAEALEIEESTARNKKYRCMEKLREMVMAAKL